jgi:Icc protein
MSVGAPGRSRLQVFAVEHDSLQISWSHLPLAQVTFEVGDHSIEVDATPPDWYRRTAGLRVPDGAGGPGAVTVTGLEPAGRYEICLSAAGLARKRVAVATTSSAPPGRLLSRFATISDCHFGERRVGALHRLHDPLPRPEWLDPYPVRCAVAAIDEAEKWGAQMIVAKGDLTQNGKAAEFRTAVDVLRRASVPVAVAFGNHDVRGPVSVANAVQVMEASGITAAVSTRSVDIPGARLILSHTPIPDSHAGRMSKADILEVVSAAREAEAPVVVALHHPLRRWPVETHYPPSLGWRDSVELARGLRRANRRSLVVAGHTHRNRRYHVRGVTVAEVGSTKDYPGQWAGYSLYEGGIRQVVRRVERPDAVSWAEMTARAIGGVWRWWSPGRIEDRCFTIQW